MMQFLKRLAVSLVAVAGLSIPAWAVPMSTGPAYYVPPTISTTTRSATIRLVGNFELRRTTDDATVYTNLSSTGLRIQDLANIEILGTDSIGQFQAGSLSKSIPRLFDLYVATPGSLSYADTRVNETNSFRNMFASAPIYAMGLTQPTTRQVTIFLGPGMYDVSGATIPAGVNLYCTAGSSVVFRPTSNSDAIFWIYGTITNCNQDFQGRTFAGYGNFIGTGARVNNLNVYGTGAADQLTANTWTLFMHQFSTNTAVDATVTDYAGALADLYRGGLGTFDNVDECKIFIRGKQGRLASGGEQTYFLRNSSHVLIGGDYQNVGGRVVLVYGGNRNTTVTGKYNITQSASQLFLVRPLEISGSSMTTFRDMDIEHRGSGGITVFQTIVDDSNARRLTGTIIKNCVVRRGPGAGNPLFAAIGLYSSGTVLMNNELYGGTFITDNSLIAQYLNLNNFVDDKLQAAATTSGGISAATIFGATIPYVLDIPTVYLSTNGPCSTPRACISAGVDTMTIVAYWFDAVNMSSNSFSGFKMIITTGPANLGGVANVYPVIQDRFNNFTVSAATATPNGRGDGFSGIFSTNVVLRAGETFTVWTTTTNASGPPTRGGKFHVDLFIWPRY